jgi:rubrerythrin
MAVFESQEIYQFAMRIEENGERFYRGAAQALQNIEAKDLFSHLADEEARHKRVFESMLSKLESYQMDERYSGEYLEYLRAYIDDKVVFNKRDADRELRAVKDVRSAIEFAIHREMEAILYFLEMKNLVSKDQQNSIEKIVEEERRHFTILSRAQKSLAATPL